LLFKNGWLFAGGVSECVRTYPAPVERVSGSVLCLVVLFANAVNLNRIFLTANDGCAAANWLLFLKYASAARQHDSSSQADE
jgi:hypothetical protein